MRHQRSSPGALARPPKIPLTPAIRPFMSQSSKVAQPTSTPPTAAEPGVKFSIPGLALFPVARRGQQYAPARACGIVNNEWPRHLDANRREPAEGVALLIFRQLFDPQSSTYSYLLGDGDTGEAVLIDPVFELSPRDSALVRELGLKLQ